MRNSGGLHISIKETATGTIATYINEWRQPMRGQHLVSLMPKGPVPIARVRFTLALDSDPMLHDDEWDEAVKAVVVMKTLSVPRGNIPTLTGIVRRE